MDSETATRTPPLEGLVLAPVTRGEVWEAVQMLHRGVREAGGSGVRAAFLTAVTEDGRVTQNPEEAALLLVGYRAEGETAASGAAPA